MYEWALQFSSVMYILCIACLKGSKKGHAFFILILFTILYSSVQSAPSLCFQKNNIPLHG